MTEKFGAWLLNQVHRRDPVGDLARDMAADDGCGRCTGVPAEVPHWGVQEVVRSMDQHNATDMAYQALNQACAEWAGTASSEVDETYEAVKDGTEAAISAEFDCAENLGRRLILQSIENGVSRAVADHLSENGLPA